MLQHGLLQEIAAYRKKITALVGEIRRGFFSSTTSNRVIIPAHAPKYLALRSHRDRFGNDGRGSDVVDHVAKIDIGCSPGFINGAARDDKRRARCFGDASR